MTETSLVQDAGYAILADLEKPYKPSLIFGNENPVELEIGAGRGDFAIGYCAENPDINLLCVERKLNYLKRGVNKARERKLVNIRFLNVEVLYLLQEYIESSAFSAIHIYFPDPWPKKRHIKRRIFQEDTLRLMADKLVPGGVLYLRTDHKDYFDHMMDVMTQQQFFGVVDTPEHVTRHQTGFEKRFVTDGLPIYKATYLLEKKPPSLEI